MLTVEIPGDFNGGTPLSLAHLVLDYNGTIAEDGALIAGVPERLAQLAEHLTIHVITADTHGTAAQQLAGLPVSLHILPPGAQSEAKAAFVRELGANLCVAIGNGRNDATMLQETALGVVVIQAEGAAQITLAAADIVSKSTEDALDLLLHPKRLIATLRN
ncbi:MAG: HAD hydrolase family protein [Halothiobacillus sp.]|nr:HAD hydrolase family protein [Halothiobacillus sp.]